MMRGGGAPTGARVLRTPGLARRDRRAGAPSKGTPCVLARGRAPLGAPPWRFLSRARARRCPAFPPGSCADLLRRMDHSYPEERVSRASQGAASVANQRRGATPSLRLARTPLEAPLMSEVDGGVADSPNEVN